MIELKQMDLFASDDQDQIQDLRNKQDKMRRGLFKRHDALLKLITSLSDEVLLLKEELYEIRQDQMAKDQEVLRLHPRENLG